MSTMSRPPPLDSQHEDPSVTVTLSQKIREGALKIYYNNKGICLILLAQVAGASMGAIARFLQLSGGGMHPLQVGSFRPKPMLSMA
jgi:hypothetical protein